MREFRPIFVRRPVRPYLERSIVTYKQINVTSDVSQEDHLSPILFCLLKISLVSFPIQKIVLLANYAFTKTYNNIDDALKSQTDLNDIYKWCNENAMHLNLRKCSTITFSLKGIPIQFNYSLD